MKKTKKEENIDLIKEYLEAQALKAKYAKIEKEAKEKVLEILEEDNTCEFVGVGTLVRNINEREGLDTRSVREYLENNDLLEEFLVETTVTKLQMSYDNTRYENKVKKLKKA